MSIINYFAYGSNMNWDDLDDWCRKKGYEPIHPATQTDTGYISGYTLVFDKRSISRNGGALNIKRSSNDRVDGVVFYLSEDDFPKIKEKEGSKYKETPVNVVLIDGRVVGAKTFKAVNNELIAPTDEYLSIVLSGAEQFLNNDCIEKIKQAADKARS